MNKSAASVKLPKLAPEVVGCKVEPAMLPAC